MKMQDFCCITELVILSSPNIIGLPVIPVSINFGTSEGRGRGESIPVLSVYWSSGAEKINIWSNSSSFSHFFSEGTDYYGNKCAFAAWKFYFMCLQSLTRALRI